MISERFKLLRQQLALSQENFGKKLGVYRSQILNIEHRKVAPKKVFVEHVCDVFHVNKLWLTEGVGDMFRESKPESELLGKVFELCRELRPEYQEIMLQHADTYLDLQKRQEQVYGFHATERSSAVKVAESSECEAE